ncbi:hypothetical protein HY385_02650 [Candidatus Daviesbacteria bacterium]|nr:hypothetical protein [Candidatus Daviesbacteria bacterium]
MSFLDKITAQLPLQKQSEAPEHFFALNIGLSQISAAVWSITGNRLSLLNQSSTAYEDHDDLITKTPHLLDEVVEGLGVEPHQVLFGVPDSWSLDDNLKEPYLKLLRDLLKDYDLEPLAYVTTTTAMSFKLQKEEGVPPTAILLGLGDFVEVTLLRGGKVVETRFTHRTDHIFEDIEKTLGQVNEVDVLPSKILLYPTKQNENLTKLKDELMSYPWMSKLSFLHFPKIDILPDDATLWSIIASAAFELHPGIDFKHLTTQVPPLPKAKIAPTQDLGFVQGDIKEKLEEEKEEVLKVETGTVERFEDLTDDNLIAPGEPVLSDKFGGKLAFLSAVTAKLPKNFIPKLPNFMKFGKSSKLIFIPAALLILILGYLFFVKATVTLLVEPRILEKDTEIVADPKAQVVDEAKQVIPGSSVETTVTGSGKGTATGNKQIGDPAKGKVTIYNKTDDSVSLSSGTTLTSGGGLKFTLDSSVHIASQSSSLGADLTTTITPGKSSPVGVTAVAVGPDSNLPASSNTENGLAVTGYSKSQVVAMISDALSGGTSKNVTVVTSDDQKKLQAKVLDDLRQKAQTELQGKLSGDKKIISEALTVVDGKYTFSKQVNDQANEFSLSATVRFRGAAYSDSDLRTIVSKLLSTNIPEGFQLNLQDMQTQADVAKVDKDGKLTFKARFQAKLLPKYDTEAIKKQIKGQGIAGAVEQVKKLEGVLGAEIKLKPSVPAQVARLPWITKNITVNITPK